MEASTAEAFEHTTPFLSALSDKLYTIKGGRGAGRYLLIAMWPLYVYVSSRGSKGLNYGLEMVNQLLAGVHIASEAETLTFGARLGFNTRFFLDLSQIVGKPLGSKIVIPSSPRKYIIGKFDPQVVECITIPRAIVILVVCYVRIALPGHIDEGESFTATVMVSVLDCLIIWFICFHAALRQKFVYFSWL